MPAHWPETALRLLSLILVVVKDLEISVHDVVPAAACLLGFRPTLRTGAALVRTRPAGRPMLRFHLVFQ